MRLVKIEDFGEHSQYIILKLCKYLDIDFDVSLEISSFGEKLYWGANPEYKSNKFMKCLHTKNLLHKRTELLLFSIMNKELNQATGYHSVQLSWLEKKLILLWLFLPFSEDFNWLKSTFYNNEYKGLPDYSGNYPIRIIMFFWLIHERFVLLKIYFRNSYSKNNYNKIKKYLINPNS
jgi:hypothetical protein